MENTIGLQVAGCAETGFDALMSINWAGRNLADFMSREDYYASPIVFFARIDSDYQTYEAVICRFEGIDLRHSAFQVAIRIPVGYSIIETATGRPVSPAGVLRPIMKKIMADHLKSFEDTYEYRGRQVPALVPGDYTAFLAPYSLLPQWGPMVNMKGSRPVYINGANDADIDRKMLCIPYVFRLSDAEKVEIGAFSSAVSTTALADDELNAQPEIQVAISTKTGTVERRELTDTPMHLNSERFGYTTDIYKNVSIIFTREETLKAFRKGVLTTSGEGYSRTMYPSKGILDVRFNPPYRRKEYEIHLKGQGVANRQNEIYEQLLYNGNPVKNHRLAFEGSSIVHFESFSSEELLRCFSLTRLASFVIEKVRRDGNEVSITLKPKEEPRVYASPSPSPSASRPVPDDNSGCQKTMIVHFDYGDKALRTIDVTVSQYISPAESCQTVFADVEAKSDSAGRYVVVSFAELAGNPAIEVRLGRPSIFKGEPHACDGQYDYEANLSGRKSALARFCSIFTWKEVSGLWPVWRGLTVVVAVLVFGLACYFLGVFTSGLGALGDVRDSFVGVEQQPVAEEDKDLDKAAGAKQIETVAQTDTSKVDTAKIADKEALNPDSIKGAGK